MVVNKSRPLAMLLLPQGHETAIPGHLEMERRDSVVIEEKFAINEVEGSKDEVKVEENARKPMEDELVRARIQEERNRRTRVDGVM